MTCPNINLPEWKRLIAAYPNLAYYLWDKFNGEIPESYYIESTLTTEQTKSDNLPTKQTSEFKVPHTIKNLLDFLSAKFGVKWETVYNPKRNSLGWVENGKVYINSAYEITAETALHEFLHPLIRAIRVRNTLLYNSLVIQMKRSSEGKAILDRIHKDYSDLNVSDREEEALVEYLGKLADNKLNATPEFLKLLQVFFKRVIEILKEIFPSIKVEDINLNTKLSDIVDILFSGNRVEVGDVSDLQANKKIEEKTEENKKAADETDTFLKELEENASSFEEVEMPENAIEEAQRLAREKRLGITGTREEDKIKFRYRDKRTKGLFDRVTMELERFFSVTVRKSAELKAKDIFLKQSKDINKDTVEYGGSKKVYTFEELKTYFENTLSYHRRLGKIAHAIVSREIARLNGDKITEEKNNKIVDDLSKGKTIDEQDIDAEKMFKFLIGSYHNKDTNTTINKIETLLTKLDVQLTKNKFADKLFSEILVAVKKINIAGRIDFIVRHFDGSMSVYDFKSGNATWKAVYDTKFMNTLSDLGIENTELNKGKLQLAMYVFMLKYNKPDAKFKNVALVNISNSYSLNMHPQASVDLRLFLQGIEKYFVNGDNQEFYKEAKAKGLFDSENYYSEGSAYSMYQADSEMSDEASVREGISKLKSSLISKNSGSIMAVTEDLLARFNKLLGTTYDITIKGLQESKDFAKGISAFTDKYNIKDKPIIELWVQLVNKAREIINKKKYLYDKEKERLLLAVKKEYLAQNPGQKFEMLNSVAGQGFQFKKFYSFMFVEKPNGIEEWVSPSDDKWKDLTDAQKAYATFLKKTAFEQFWMTMHPKRLANSYDEYIKTDMYKDETDTEKKRIEEVIAKARNAPDVNKLSAWNYSFTWDNWYDTKTPRMGALNNEIFEKTDVKGGVVNTIRQKVSQFNQPSGRDITEANGIEVKYIPENTSPMVLERTYSYDVTTTMDKFMENMLNKEHYDDLYYLNLGIQRIFKDTEQANHEGEFFMGNYNYIKDLMHIMILKTNHPDKPVKGVYPSRIVRLLSSWVSNSIMMLKPTLAVSNFLLNNIMLHKEALKGGILEGMGHDKSSLFNLKDLGNAWKEFSKSQKSLFTGDDNKMHNILKRFNYHTDSYDYVVHEKHKTVGKNKALTFSNFFIMQTAVERNTTALILMSLLMHQKNEVTGKSLWDSMDENGDWIGGKRGFNSRTNSDITELTYEELENMRSISAKIMGGYRQDEKVGMNLSWWGASIMMFKRFIPSVMGAMWNGKYKNRSFGYYQNKGTIVQDGISYPLLEWASYDNQGTFWTTGYFLKAMLVGTFFKSSPKDAAYQWENLSDRQKANLMEMLLSVGLFTAGTMAYSFAWGDGDDNDIWRQRCIFLTQDMIQAIHVMNILNMVKSPAVLPVKLYDYFTSIGQLSGSIFEDDTITRGVHKGEYKGWEGIKKGTPGLSIIYNFEQISNNADVVTRK